VREREDHRKEKTLEKEKCPRTVSLSMGGSQSMTSFPTSIVIFVVVVVAVIII